MATKTYASFGHQSVGQPVSSDKTKILASHHKTAVIAQDRVFRFGWPALHIGFMQLSTTDDFYVEVPVPPYTDGLQLRWYTETEDATVVLDFNGAAAVTVVCKKPESAPFHQVLSVYPGVVDTDAADTSIRLKMTASEAMNFFSFEIKALPK